MGIELVLSRANVSGRFSHPNETNLRSKATKMLLPYIENGSLGVCGGEGLKSEWVTCGFNWAGEESWRLETGIK